MSATAFNDVAGLAETTEVDAPVESALGAPRRLAPSFGRPSRLRLAAPLAIVLIVETLLSLRRGGGPLAVESASYAQHHALLSPVTSRLMGDPAVYPRLARALVSLGGLGLLRASSLVFVLFATILVFSLGRRLFGDLAGVLAGAVFGLSAPVLALGYLGVADPLALALLTAGAFLALSVPRLTLARQLTTVVQAEPRKRPARRFALTTLTGAMCGLAAVNSFAVAAVLPVAALLVFVGSREGENAPRPSRRSRLIAASAFTGGVAVTKLCLAAADKLLPRALGTPFKVLTSGGLPFSSIAIRSLESLAPEIVLAVVAAAIIAFSRSRRESLPTAGVLFAALPCVIAYQVVSHTSSSLLENEAYAMVFVAPLIGAGLSRVLRRCGKRAVMPVVAVLAVVLAFSAASFLPDLAWSVSANGGRPVPSVNLGVAAESSGAH